MQKKLQYPQHPIRATVIAFVCLAVYVSVFMPFQEELRRGWLLAFGYCAFLAVVSVGLVRLGRRALLLLGIPAAVALVPGVVGVALALRPGASVESGSVWLGVSLYLLYALGVWGLCLVVKGWSLYFGEPHEAT